MKFKKMTQFFRGALVAALFLFGQSVYAQTVTVSGHVKDDLDLPVIGASVLEEGTTNGTITDYDGNFTLQVNANAKLTVSYVGYDSQTVEVNGKTQLVIQLSESSVALTEVVAIGYGSQKKKEVTGSVASVKAEDFNVGVKNSPMGLLQGKVAGLNISRQGGDPTNTGYNIQIRGFSTLDKGAGTSPLYIVDGIPVNNIDNIAPEEIASMDVLKDGSAAAIYGTRGTNGVIIITTKRGAEASAGECGTMKVEYSGYVSYSAPRGSTGMATVEEYRNLSELSGGKITPVIYDEGQYETDWMKEMMNPAPITHNHSVAGNWGVDGDPEYWIPGAVVMTRQEDGTYTLTKEVPAGFEYKYVVSADGVAWDWEYECSVSFVMPLSLKPVDVVEAWKNEPWATEETPAE